MKRFNGPCLLALAAASAACGGHPATPRNLDVNAVSGSSAAAGPLRRPCEINAPSEDRGFNAVWGANAVWGSAIPGPKGTPRTPVRGELA